MAKQGEKTKRRKRVREEREKKGLRSDFVRKLFGRRASAKVAGEAPPCECWDCIRAAGLTPPLHLRAQHSRKYPHQELGADAQGDPYVTVNKKSDHDNELKGTEGRHLREAVRNRSAI